MKYQPQYLKTEYNKVTPYTTKNPTLDERTNHKNMSPYFRS